MLTWGGESSVGCDTIRVRKRLTGLGHHEDVVAATEGIREEGDGAEEDIRVAALGLLSRGTVEVPLLELVNGRDGAVKGLRKIGGQELEPPDGCSMAFDSSVRGSRLPARLSAPTLPAPPPSSREPSTTLPPGDRDERVIPGRNRPRPIGSGDSPQHTPFAIHSDPGSASEGILTVVLQRSPPWASIQTYSVNGGADSVSGCLAGCRTAPGRR